MDGRGQTMPRCGGVFGSQGSVICRDLAVTVSDDQHELLLNVIDALKAAAAGPPRPRTGTPHPP